MYFGSNSKRSQRENESNNSVWKAPESDQRDPECNTRKFRDGVPIGAALLLAGILLAVIIILSFIL